MYETALIFDNVFNKFLKEFPEVGLPPQSGFPIMDYWIDSDGSANLAFALAGYNPDDLEVSVEGSTLTVAAKACSEEVNKNRRIARRAFSKSFTDRNNVYDLHNLKASFVNGELKILLPVKEKAKKKLFPVSSK